MFDNIFLKRLDSLQDFVLWNSGKIKRIENTMTIDDIKKLIASDESRTLELKKTTGELKDGMHSACAFLNTEGGEITEGKK